MTESSLLLPERRKEAHSLVGTLTGRAVGAGRGFGGEVEMLNLHAAVLSRPPTTAQLAVRASASGLGCGVQALLHGKSQREETYGICI